MLRICTLASGSNGNCTFVSDGTTNLLIDAGISARAITRELDALGIAPDALDAILITHEHSDHIRGLEVLEKKWSIPIHAAQEATAGTMAELIPALAARICTFSTDESFSIGSLSVTPFRTPHDTPHSVGFRLEGGGRCAVSATDLGYVPDEARELMCGADLVLLEANYDDDALRAGRYPPMLKRRIAGRNGHLSNRDCADCAVYAVEHGVKYVLLGHLSAENNTPKLAYDTVHMQLTRRGVIPGVDMMLQVAPRGARGQMFELD